MNIDNLFFVPSGKTLIRNSPLLSVFVSLVIPAAWFLATTLQFGIEAPLMLMTVPTIVPEFA
jgi:hypothetical protein